MMKTRDDQIIIFKGHLRNSWSFQGPSIIDVYFILCTCWVQRLTSHSRLMCEIHELRYHIHASVYCKMGSLENLKTLKSPNNSFQKPWFHSWDCRDCRWRRRKTVWASISSISRASKSWTHTIKQLYSAIKCCLP